MKSEATGYIRELDALRGIAILFVTLHHFWPISGPVSEYSFLTDFIHIGWMGVDLFFIISGFLICGILIDTKGDKNYLKNFYIRRTIRIFPLYYISIIILFISIPVIQMNLHEVSYDNTQFIKE